MNTPHSREVALLRRDVAASFTQTATRGAAGAPQRQPGGGWIQPSSAGATFPCRLTPLTREAAEGVIGGSVQSRMYYWLHYPLDVTLTAKDTVTVDALQYQVQGVMDPSGYAPARRALVWRDSE